MSCRARCRLMERVSSVGAVPKTSESTQLGEEGCSYQETNAVMPFWATRPRAERSSALSRRYQGRVVSSSRRIMVDSVPMLARSRSSVSDVFLTPVARGGLAVEAVPVTLCRSADAPAMPWPWQGERCR